MRFESINETVEGFQNETRRISSKAISNGFLPEKAAELFEKFDSKMNSIKIGIHKTKDVVLGGYEYRAPKSQMQNNNVTEATLKGELIFNKTRLEKLQKNLKAEKYKIVDSSKNKISYLKRDTKGLFTKAISDLNNLIKLY